MTLKELELLANRNDAFRFAEAIQLDLDKALAELKLLRELVKDPRADTQQFDPTCAWCRGDPDWDAEIATHKKGCPWLKWKETYQP